MSIDFSPLIAQLTKIHTPFRSLSKSERNITVCQSFSDFMMMIDEYPKPQHLADTLTTFQNPQLFAPIIS